MARKPKGRMLDGILLVDKPAGLTSNGVLQRVKRLYGAAKAGHTGALDPLATGMLPITFGEATKFSQFLLDADKRYLTTAKLGVRTTTSDADGDVVEQREVPADLDRARIEALLEAHFLGEIEQVPSMYSALKHQGQPLYKLARKGVQVEVKPRRVTIYEIRMTALRGDEIDLDIRCSKGTYIRSIVEDLGLLLGCGAHVQMLRRLDTGPYKADMMIGLEQLQSLATPAAGSDDEKGIQARLDALLLPVTSALEDLPSIELEAEQAQRVLQGQRLALRDVAAVELIKIFERDNGRFLGIAQISDDGVLRPRRLLATA
ncbi:tRNA pseudouridine synthase B [Marinobacterium nitratireducens]|uniref:tRNA pseudouridine synthase B n=1 Tax=Marinobacterium nitratireducens TaxID=518897 RepID=A0A918DYS3_9GAMM|nr:tRNA pseudouridine(55) synthase TruB [Marinobacterium nitratireducens]GGO88617.1 tRNA pseudouridine synthase B [Marinobacterium nitratireducens]